MLLPRDMLKLIENSSNRSSNCRSSTVFDNFSIAIVILLTQYAPTMRLNKYSSHKMERK